MTPELVTLAEHYSIRQDEHVDDVTWLADSAARGWVALGKTSAFAAPGREGGRAPRRRPRLLPTRGDLSGEVYGERILANLEAITRARVPRPGRSSTCCSRTGSSAWPR